VPGVVGIIVVGNSTGGSLPNRGEAIHLFLISSDFFMDGK
jgi:hypothetical protein